MRLTLLLSCLLFVSCGSNPRVVATWVANAAADRLPRPVRVVKVWDALSDGYRPEGGVAISHYIEVDVETPAGGKEAQTWPYDEWAVGLKPPSVGSRLVVSPADWVRGEGHGRSRIRP